MVCIRVPLIIIRTRNAMYERNDNQNARDNKLDRQSNRQLVRKTDRQLSKIIMINK